MAAHQELFFDMRHVSRAFEQLGGESVRQFAKEQYESGWHRRRKHPRKVKIVGDVARGRILLVDVHETDEHTSNGRLEAGVEGGKNTSLSAKHGTTCSISSPIRNGFARS